MKEIFEALASRIKSPVFGYFLLAWVVINWKPLFYLFFDDNPASQRVAIFEKLTSTYSMALLPLIFAVAAAVIYPWINCCFLMICRMPTDVANSIQAVSEHKLIIKKQQLEKARSFAVATREEELIERAKRDEVIASISDEDAKERLQNEISELRTELDAKNSLISKSSLSKNKTDMAESYKMMAQLLQQQGKIDEAANYLKMAMEIEQRQVMQSNV